MVVNKENRCKFCPKVFCCSDCRGAHENSQHANNTESDCSLCKQKDLVFKPPKTPKEQIVESHKSELFCHLVSNHLPLYCKLCGTKYKSIDDLQASKPCSWWTKRRTLKQTPNLKTLFTKNNNHEQKDSPLYPANEFLQKKNKSLVIRPKQENYIRQTSTPMQALNQFIAPSTPSFEQLPTFETNSSACSSATSSGFESKYYTGLDGVNERLSLESKGNQTEDVSEKQSEAAPTWNGTPAKHEAAVDGSSSKKRFRLPAGQPEAEPEDEVRSEAKRMERKRKIEDESGDSPSSSTANCSDEKKVRRVADSSDGESNSLNSQRGPTLVMMMLLDQSNLKGLSDLTPLIDSSLKKLEENNFSSTEKENGSTEMILEKGSSGSGLILRSCRRASLTLNLSERVECFSGSFQSRQSQEVSQEQQQPPADSYKPAGIFSAMARVFRCALEKLPALTPQYQSIPETPTEVVPRVSTQIKRSLEREDSSASSSAIELYPAAKRYRDWSRIKARDPIARMRTKVHQSTQTEDLELISKDAQIAF